MKRRCFAAAGLAALVAPRAIAQAAAARPRAASNLRSYALADKLSGGVAARGSSTVATLLKEVTEAFAVVQPGVTFDIVGAGSSTALAGMLDSPATLGLLSRPINARERERFRAQYGHEPTQVKIAVDALGVFVFKNNPVKALSLSELRRAFGRDPDAVNRWSALVGEQAVGADWRNMPITRFGLERGRGAYELFRDIVLEGSDFASDISIERVSTSVVQGVATEAGGIGYASVYFRTERTRLLPLMHKGEVVEPTADNALSGKYPLARFLHVIVNRKPGTPLDAALHQFLYFLLSRDGQDVVARQGFFPLDAAVAGEGLAQIGMAASPAK